MQNTNNKPIILLLALAVLLLVYIAFKPKGITTPEKETKETTSESVSNTNKESNPEFIVGSKSYNEFLLELKNLDPNAGVDRNASVESWADVTGDGVDEGLVSIGTGGSAMDSYAVIKVENGKPVLTKIKDENGNTSYFSGMSGSGGSGRYGGMTGLLPEQNSLYTSSYMVYGSIDDYCGASVYTWNSGTKMFEYKKTLSKQKTDEILVMCNQLASDTGVKYKGN